MPLYNPSGVATPGIAVATYPFALTTSVTLNVQQNSFVWGALFYSGSPLMFNSYTCYCGQTATGNIQFAMYTASDSNIVAGSTSNTAAVTALGFLTATLSSSLSLSANTPYYMTMICTANGAGFASGSGLSFNNPPKGSWFASSNAGAFPATLGALSGTASVIWIQGNT